MAEPPADQAPSFSFQPPVGGDVSLKSSNGTIFTVHSMFLSFSSKVFSDMFASSTKADVVELAEDAETVSLMLAFIYPAVRPPIDTVPLLEKAMIAAHKYEIEVLTKTLEQIAGQQRALIRKDPLRIFRLATDCGLHEIQTLSARLMTPSHCDMATVNGLVQFAKEHPESSRIIGIVGAQGARARVLDSLSPDNSTTLWPVSNCRDERGRLTFKGHMVCESCWGGGQPHRYRPGWLGVWFTRLRSDLVDKLLDECDSYFELSYIATLRGGGGGCWSCVDHTSGKTVLFEEWAKNTRSQLETKLVELDVLYTL